MTDAPTTPRWTEYQPIHALVPADRNAKDHDQAAMAASVEAFGFLEPVIVDERTGQLLAGHGRVEYLTQLHDSGQPPPDGVVVDEFGFWCWLVVRGISSRDDAHAEAMGIALNRVGELGGWQSDVLVEALDAIQTAGLLDTVGFTAEYLDDLIASSVVPDFEPSDEAPARLDQQQLVTCPNCQHEFARV